MNKTKDYDLRISFLRLLSMILIVMCHFFQYYNFFLAWWFNVGVQIFLFISGFLYGKKTEINDVEFLLKNFYKILLDFFCYITIIFLVLKYGMRLENISFSLYIKQVLCINHLPGLEHLWYIPCILLCYLLTPFFDKVDYYLKKDNRYVIKLILLLFIIQIIGLYYTKNVNSVWIICYAIGFYYSRYFLGKNKEFLFYTVSIIFCIFLNLLLITKTGNNFLSLLNIEDGSLILQLIKDYGHIFLAVTIFLFVYKIFSIQLFSNKIFSKILYWSDKYSYDVYLVHQFYIFGGGTLVFLEMTNNLVVNFLIVIILIIISAIFLKFICFNLNKLIRRE